jgi:hypothetical protein
MSMYLAAGQGVCPDPASVGAHLREWPPAGPTIEVDHGTRYGLGDG